MLIVAGGRSLDVIQRTAARPISAAVAQCHGSDGTRLTATPWDPKVLAVSAAPTVPEWMIEWPVLIPALIPDTTTS